VNPAAPDKLTHLAIPALVAGLVLGILGDLLFHDANPGINLLIWVAALAGAAQFTSYRFHGALNGTEPWLLVAISFASLQAVRDAEPLRVANILAMVLCLGLAGFSQLVEPRNGRLLDYVVSLRQTAIRTALGVLPILAVTDWSALRRRDALGTATRVLTGLVLAVPVVLVFGSLFASADPQFGRVVRWLVDWDIKPLVTHAIGIAFFSWLAAGLLRAWLWPRIAVAAPGAGALAPSIGPLPIQIALGSMVLVFAIFTAIQARWLFGGEAAVLAGTGLSYAALARQGFFEMVAASALAIPLLYGAEALHVGAAPGAVRSLRRLGTVQLVLVLLTMATALARVRMYTEAYGLTIDRINGTAVIAWLGAVIAWFGVTVLRGRSERFTFGAITSGLAVLGMLNIVNPEAQIVRVNTERAVAGAVLDRGYLAALSADAVPLLTARLHSLPSADACEIGTSLRKRWLDPARKDDWRS